MLKRFILPLFKRQVMEYAFTLQKPNHSEFSKMKFAFLDSKGRRHFYYEDEFQMPVLRRRQLEIKVQELDSGVSLDTLGLWLDNIDEELKKNDKGEALVNIGRLTGLLRTRLELDCDVELLMKMACIIYVREDQNPHVWDEDLEREKFNQLMEDRSEVLWDFFISTGLSVFLPSFRGIREGFKEYSTRLQAEITKFHKVLQERKDSMSN